MVAVAEISWQDIIDGKPFPENPARKAWREAVAEIAERAKQVLPEANGRIDAAVKIVLAGDVELLPDGNAKVASQSNGQTVYHVVNGECSCKDFSKAPQGFCKHRIALGLYKRAKTLATQRLEQQLDGTTNGQHAAKSPKTEAPVAPLPEAPASCNVYVEISGRKVQMTLRDADEEHLLKRLRRLLEHFSGEANAQARESPKPRQRATVRATSCK